MVALRKESVDRNPNTQCFTVVNFASLSARRAWIEIFTLSIIILGLRVALRKESVDRNSILNFLICAKTWSLSARRAWIEISKRMSAVSFAPGRSPQGERG